MKTTDTYKMDFVQQEIFSKQINQPLAKSEKPSTLVVHTITGLLYETLQKIAFWNNAKHV
jgi:hypothetical protein